MDGAGAHDLAAVVHEVVDELLPADRERVDVFVERGVRIAGARRLLVRALANVVQNAVEHSPAGRRVRLTAHRAGTTAVIEVHDDGPGIPAAERERVFEPFFSTRPGAAGLGLTVTKSVVRTHGGEVRLVDGAGCTVRIEVPRAVAEVPLRPQIC